MQPEAPSADGARPLDGAPSRDDVRPSDGAAYDARPVTPPPPPPPHEEGLDPSTLPRIRWWIVLPAAALAVFAFLRLHAMGAGPRRERAEAARAESAAYDPRPTVEVVRAKRGKNTLDLRLPAELDAMQETAVFARATGYVKSVLADIGDVVPANRPLAEIATPEVDAQVVTAKAAVAVANTNVAKTRSEVALAESTLRRFAGAAQGGGSVAAQDVDEKRSALAQARSSLAAAEASVVLAEADVKRLTTLQQFETVSAPFAGVVTARGFDVGALVGPSGPSASTPMFRLQRSDVLRVWVDLPQAYVGSATPKAKAWLTVRNGPAEEVEAALARTAGALDPATRTLRCSFEVANADGKLLPGMFGELRFPVTIERPTLTVPTSAPTFGASGPTVWVVEKSRVHPRKATLGRDFGTEIEVVDGLEGGEDVVRNPGERLVDGLEVVVVGADASPAMPMPRPPPPPSR